MKSVPQICNFQFVICNFHFLRFSFALRSLRLAVCRSERLRESKLDLSLVQTKVRIERSVRVQSLRNQELRRIQKITGINGQRAAQWRLDAKSQAPHLRPSLP